MNNLKQNNLAEATTDIGFVKTINENAGENLVALQKEVTLDDNTIVTVEGITPNKMKTILNHMVDGSEETITFATPGENYNDEIKGVCQIYNESIVVPTLTSIKVTTMPNKVTYTSGEIFDKTGMVVKATYSNGSSKEVTEYTVTPDTLTKGEEDKVTVTITFEDKTTTIEVTVNEA